MSFIQDQDYCRTELLRLTEAWFITCDPDHDELAGFRFWREHCELHFLKYEYSECKMGLKRIRQMYDAIIKDKVIQESLIPPFDGVNDEISRPTTV